MPHTVLGAEDGEGNTCDNHPCLHGAGCEQTRSPADSMSHQKSSVGRKSVGWGIENPRGRGCGFCQGVLEPLKTWHLQAHLKEGRERACDVQEEAPSRAGVHGWWGGELKKERPCKVQEKRRGQALVRGSDPAGKEPAAEPQG